MNGTKRGKIMSRKLKFRAWDKLEKPWNEEFKKEMIYNVAGIEFWINSIRIVDEDRHNWIDFKDVEIMQYTGIKDKNGKEIYEGDIIRLKHHIDKRINVVGKVVFLSEQASFGIIDDLGQEYPLFRNTTEQIEIIGNIYENSELLEGKDD